MLNKTWKVAVIAASVTSAYASEQIQPLFTSLLPAEQQQVLVSKPLALTDASEQQLNVDTFARKVFAFENHVWLLSEQGVSVLERTTSGLVSRAKLNLQVLNLNANGSKSFLVSPNGKKVLVINTWQNRNDYIEIDLNNDFTLASKTGKIDSSVTNLDSIQFYSDNSFKTRIWSNGNYIAQYYSLNDNGISYSGSLLENNYDNILYSEKTKTIFTKTSNYNQLPYSITVTATKLNADKPAIRSTFQINVPNYYGFDNGFIFDEITNKLILSGYQGAYTLNYNAETVTFSNQVATTSTALFGRDMYLNGVISSDYKLIDSSADYLKRTDSGYSYHSVVASLGNHRDKVLTFNSKNSQLELWSLGEEGQGVTQYTIVNGQLVKGLAQDKTELGFSNILQNGYQISSADSPLLFVGNSNRMEVYKTDSSNKIVRLNLDSIENNYYNSHDNVEYLGDGYYILSSQNQTLKVLKESEGNTLALVQTLNVGSYFQFNSNFGFKISGKNVILKSDREIVLLNFDGEKLSYLSKVTSQNNDLITQNGRTELVKLDNKLYFLQPESKRYLEINIVDRLLNLNVAGKMPFISMETVESASDRLFVRTHYNTLVTLMKNAAGDLVPNAIDNQNTEFKFFKNRFAVNSTYNANFRNFSVNDAITGIWSEALVSTCCDDASKIFVTNNTLMTYNTQAPQKLTTYKLNTAPYLPVIQPELKLNQGVSQSVNLTAMVADDEKDSLQFSGSLPVGFSVNNTGALNFDGTTAGSGTYTVSVSDGSLAADLRLPYRINAAPALEKALPTVTVNEKQRLSLELSEYFSDLEGQAISFSAEPLKGFSVSKAGLLSGIPADTSSTGLAFKTTDSVGAVSSHNIVVNVNAAPVWTNVTSQTFIVGDAAKIEIAAAFSDREGGPLTFQASNLPAGLTLTAGAISGSPTKSGNFEVTIQATDAGGAVGSGTLNITVNDKKSGGSTGPVSFALLAGLALWRRRLDRNMN